MAVSSAKLRTLYIMKMLLEKTDEKYTMSAADINKVLREYGMSADRKTVYSDVETLREFGIDVLQTKGTNSGYYIGSRDFELPELKLLVDAVQALFIQLPPRAVQLRPVYDDLPVLPLMRMSSKARLRSRLRHRLFMASCSPHGSIRFR